MQFQLRFLLAQARCQKCACFPHQFCRALTVTVKPNQIKPIFISSIYPNSFGQNKAHR